MNHAADKPLEVAIAHLLRVGVLIAAAFVFAGGVRYLVEAHGGRVDYRSFTKPSAQLTSLPGIVASAKHGDALGLIQFGLLLLLATPIARVALALLGFAYEHDWLYVVVSAVVLGVLLFSLIHAT